MYCAERHWHPSQVVSPHALSTTAGAAAQAGYFWCVTSRRSSPHLRHLACLASLCLAVFRLSAQEGIPIAYTAPHIASVRLHPAGAPLGGPFLELDGEAPLVLKFDDLSGDWPDYAWTLVHCTADWSGPSDLRDWDYLEGWAPDRIDQVEASFGGSVSFAHVATTIPSEGLRPTRSGNHLLVVHEEGDPDAVVLLRRLIIFERLADVGLTLRRPYEADRVPTHQRVEVDVELPPGHRWSAPMRDISLTVLRNVDWTAAGLAVNASMVRGTTVRFDQDPQLTFSGGDRWRSADLKSLSYLAPGIEAMRESRGGDGPLWKVEMATDASRRFRLQSSRPDLNGAFTIHNDRFDDVELTSDYLEVTFSLEHRDFGDVPDVYLFGGLTGWSVNPAFRMAYNSERQEYQLTTLLKQGWYDYRYVAVGPQSGHTFEAEHAGTPNRYTVFVHAPAPDGTDRIIGMESLTWN